MEITVTVKTDAADDVRRLAALLLALAGDGDALATPAPVAAPAGESDPAWCGIHGVKMSRRERDGQVWFSHRTPDGGWCRGKNGRG
jgi:hypothetical protein